MENIEGGASKPCSENQVLAIIGTTTALTIFRGAIGAWAGVAMLYSCILKAN